MADQRHIQKKIEAQLRGEGYLNSLDVAEGYVSELLVELDSIERSLGLRKDPKHADWRERALRAHSHKLKQYRIMKQTIREMREARYATQGNSFTNRVTDQFQEWYNAALRERADALPADVQAEMAWDEACRRMATGAFFNPSESQKEITVE